MVISLPATKSALALFPAFTLLIFTSKKLLIEPVIANGVNIELEINKDPVIIALPLNGNPLPDAPPTDAVVNILLVAVFNTNTLLADVVSVTFTH